MAIIDINTIIDPPMKLAGKGERYSGCNGPSPLR
ncbi:uncharacterized protein FFMR_01878 [Fusarium fujikuroi]|nr:uncharacterized protein FFM5_00313 [Fusarium fujikuroi]SCO30607.1 uncharacterized protein FFMR_01878 [Fusarium fujikuroi]